MKEFTVAGDSGDERPKAVPESVRQTGHRGGLGGSGSGSTEPSAAAQASVDEVTVGSYRSIVGYDVSVPQSTFDLSNWPQGYGNDPVEYSEDGTPEPVDDAISEVVATNVSFSNLDEGFDVRFTYRGVGGGELWSGTVTVPDPSTEGYEYWEYYDVIAWNGKFPYELNEPGQYSVDVSGGPVDATETFTIENPSPVRHSGRVAGDPVRLIDDGATVIAWNYVTEEWDEYDPRSSSNDIDCVTARRVTEEAGLLSNWKDAVANAGLNPPCIGGASENVYVSSCDMSMANQTVSPGDEIDFAAQVTNDNDAPMSVKVRWVDQSGTVISIGEGSIGGGVTFEIPGDTVTHDELLNTVGAGDHDIEAEVYEVTPF